MQGYDIAVVGAGPAGIMAAIRAGQLKKNVVLVERNETAGKKILITGKGRCNVTNRAPIDTFVEKFGQQGNFLRSAFNVFFNQDLIEFFESNGLDLKTERQGRVFPVTDRAGSIIDILKKSLHDSHVQVLYNMRLTKIDKKDDFFQLDFENKKNVFSRKVILAAGGASYQATGSTGDGFSIARNLRHTILPLRPALVPLKTKESWVKRLQGLTLKNINLVFEITGIPKVKSDDYAFENISGGNYDKKNKAGTKIVSRIGELLFTHFGISGPLILDLSGEIVSILQTYKQVRLFIDLKPGLTQEQIEKRLLNEFKAAGSAQLNTVMKEWLPQRLIAVFLELLKLDPRIQASQITQGQRRTLVDMLKALPLTITGALPLEEGMVTGGGVSTKEIDPRTMESKIVPGLYFAGEIIDGCAASGGYNLQQAFSTGYLAGQEAAGA